MTDEHLGVDLKELVKRSLSLNEITQEEALEIESGLEAVKLESLPEELVSNEKPQSNINAEIKEDIYKVIANLNLAGKVKLALLGNMQARKILIGDKSKMIQGCVLRNPRLTQGEVEEFAKNINTTPYVLKLLAKDSKWMKNYIMKLYLVSNPKTPPDTSVHWVKFLEARDLRKLMKSKSLPQAVIANIRRTVNDIEQKGRG